MSPAAYYNEIDPYAAQWIRNLIDAGHIAPGVVDERSIEDVHPSDLEGFTQCHFFAGVGVWSHALRRAGWPDSRPVWTGSCPCQPFSQAGKGVGMADERHLWPAFFHLIEKCKPSVVLGEQVAGKDGLAWLDLVLADLEAAGYAAAALDLCAAGVGAPHLRQRLYWVANSGGARLAQRERNGRVQREAMESHPREAAVGGGPTGRMAHSNGRHASAEGIQRSGQHGQQSEDGSSGGLAYADRPRPTALSRDTGEVCRLSEAECEPKHGAALPGGSGAVGGAGPVNGFWRVADWLGCTDGFWRPVEPGSFPLAHGINDRVGKVRAYGNAINAEAARVFIEAVMESS